MLTTHDVRVKVCTECVTTLKGKGTTQGKGRKGPVSGSYDLIGLRAFIKPLPDQQRPAVTPPITNNYATNTVTLPPTPSTIVRKENTIIPTFFAVKYWRRCLERLLGQNLHSRKGFYGLGHWWAARWEIRRCPDQFPSVISTVGDGRVGGGGEGWPWHTWLLGEGGSRDIKWCGVWSQLCTPGDPLALLRHTVASFEPRALLRVGLLHWGEFCLIAGNCLQ